MENSLPLFKWRSGTEQEGLLHFASIFWTLLPTGISGIQPCKVASSHALSMRISKKRRSEFWMTGRLVRDDEMLTHTLAICLCASERLRDLRRRSVSSLIPAPFHAALAPLLFFYDSRRRLMRAVIGLPFPPCLGWSCCLETLTSARMPNTKKASWPFSLGRSVNSVSPRDTIHSWEYAAVPAVSVDNEYLIVLHRTKSVVWACR